ncbi:MAG: hypothetical protein ACYC5O_13680 [Anaerolineae bacterium]
MARALAADLSDSGSAVDALLELAQRHLPGLTADAIRNQSMIPALARDPLRMTQVRAAVAEVPTRHRLVHGDARNLGFISSESVHLIVTSPPYWTLKEYNHSERQLGDVSDYDHFNDELALVWPREMALTPALSH